MRSVPVFLLVSLTLAIGCDSGDGAAGGQDVSSPPAADSAAVDVAPADAAVAETAVPDDVAAPPEVAADAGVAPDPDAAPEVAAAIDAVAVADVAAETVEAPCPDPAALLPTSVGGLLYRDGDRSSFTIHAGEMRPPEDEPLAGVAVRLIGERAEAEVRSCPDGRFAFGQVGAGVHLLDVDLPRDVPATTTNRSARLAEAVREGRVRLVTLGDSIPVESPDVLFPTRVAALIEPLAPVDEVNVAVGGSESIDWLPGGHYFEDRLAPELPGADVVIISLGGNDLLNSLGHVPTSFEEAMQMLTDVWDIAAEIQQNVLAIIAEIRAREPMPDIVYCLYPNYAASDYAREFIGGEYMALAQQGIDVLMADFMRTFAAVDGIVLADIFHATRGTDITPLLVDELHLSDAGAKLYAEQIFLSLGGVRVGEEPLGLERDFGFYLSE